MLASSGPAEIPSHPLDGATDTENGVPKYQYWIFNKISMM